MCVCVYDLNFFPKEGRIFINKCKINTFKMLRNFSAVIFPVAWVLITQCNFGVLFFQVLFEMLGNWQWAKKTQKLVIEW